MAAFTGIALAALLLFALAMGALWLINRVHMRVAWRRATAKAEARLIAEGYRRDANGMWCREAPPAGRPGHDR